MRTRTTDAGAARAAAIRYARDWVEPLIDGTERWSHGRLLHAAAYPDYHVLNCVRVEGAAPDLDASTLAEVAVAHGRDRGFAKVVVEDAADFDRLRPELTGRGWKSDRFVFMRHPGPVAVPEAIDVREATEDEVRPLRFEWAMTEDWHDGREETVRAFMETEDRAEPHLGSRLIAAEDGDGGVAGFVRTRRHGDAGEVALAYVRPEHRGRGLGAALVSVGAADLHARGLAHVLIVADDEDRPKHLYARLGFEPVWHCGELLLLDP